MAVIVLLESVRILEILKDKHNYMSFKMQISLVIILVDYIGLQTLVLFFDILYVVFRNFCYNSFH